ncbi:heterodisulfide reductase-related iron-sulfur binding cluster [uncultured Slackia sp.]|uniref:heterodisulfide reductase-related iron-sulfur binding cluster n=1 Tax=uncultured Slackia sp. TaxID=665903 RepID=UPI0026DEFB41|nr:heterodisulfide reductase-related iron-sulfur binding cluster [uncultured Slackia sp.]
MDAVTPTRELFWNISGQWVMYPLFLAVVAFFVLFYVRRVKLWRIGRPDDRSGHVGLRLRGALRDAVLQVRVLREKKGGIIHLAMYAGMIVLLLATALTAADADLGTSFVQGRLYLYFFSLTVDVAGLLFCIGMAAALIRRAMRKNRGLDTSASDIVILVALLAIGISGFCVEGLRIVGTDDPWRFWSPVGNVFAALFAGLDAEQISAAHRILWWSHLVLAFVVLGAWTYTKLVHVLLVPAGVYFRTLDHKATLPYIDLEDEELDSMGVGSIDEFTWKDLFDAEACIRCGRCVNNCPASMTGKELSPKGVVQGLRVQLEEHGPSIAAARKAADRGDGRKEGQAAASGASERIAPVGSVLSENALWDCTTCGACQEQCPAMIEVPSKIVKMRTYQVSMESAFPSEAQQSFRALENNGNPWGLGWQTRANWAEGLDVPTLAENPDAEYVFWPGCSGAFDARNRKVSIALVKLLKAARVDFAIIGNEEKCCGDAARRMGNEYVYYMLASENIATLNSYGVKKIITQCPHCFTSLSVDYPQLGGRYEVIHHAELLERLVAEGRLPIASGASKRVAYHDSCYLGRYNGIYEEPRSLLRAAGRDVVEMERAFSESFCCGAGGGRMWLEEKEGARINFERARQALETDPDEVCTACPFCLTMLSDGVAAKDAAVPVRDIAEILADSLPEA